MVGVDFPVSCEVAFDYLADPRRRAEWQSSLRRVDDVVGPVGVGQTWVDVTVPGLRPRLETTELDRPRRWAERGTWRRFRATLTLTFAPTASGCRVSVDLALTAGGAAAPVAAVLGAVAPYAVRADLRRAARLLSRAS